MHNVFLILNLVVVLYIWFDTDAIVEWAKLFHLKFMKYDEYYKNKQTVMPYALYSEFIEGKYGPENFICRLITCPICFSVWCNILLAAIFYSQNPLILLGPDIICTWVVYHFVKIIIKKANE